MCLLFLYSVLGMEEVEGGRTFAKKFAMYRGLNRVNVFVDL